MKQQDREFEEKVVQIDRITRVVAGGRRMRFRAMVVVGNRKGNVGFGIAKANEVPIAISKAVTAAKKNLISVPLVNDTISYEITYSFGSTKIFLKPASIGTGLIAGTAVRTVLELVGIKNILSKIYGSTNKINAVQAAYLALKNMSTKEHIMASRRIS